MPPELEEVLDPFHLTRPEPVTETRSFFDPLQPGKKITFTFRADADRSHILKVQRVAAAHIQTFVTGDTNGSRAPLLPAGDRAIDPEPDLFYFIAALEVLEVKPDHRPKFNVQQWAALSVMMPSAFSEISDWGDELLLKARGMSDDTPPLDSAAATEKP